MRDNRECHEHLYVLKHQLGMNTGRHLGIFFFLRKAAHYQNQVSAPQTSACTSVTLASCSDGCGCGRRSAAKPRVLRSRQAQVPLVQLVQATLGSKAVGDGLQVGLTLVSQDTLKLNDLLCTEEVVVLQFVI